MEFHLAAVNIAIPLFPLQSPEMHGFTSRLDEVNKLADNAEGFVWRLIEDGTLTPSDVVFEYPGALVNMSVWVSVEALIEYTYKGTHREVFGNRHQWFQRADQASFALWWVPAGHIPSLEEAKAKLDAVRANGPTPEAFTFANRFPAPATAQAATTRG